MCRYSLETGVCVFSITDHHSDSGMERYSVTTTYKTHIESWNDHFFGEIFLLPLAELINIVYNLSYFVVHIKRYSF